MCPWPECSATALNKFQNGGEHLEGEQGTQDLTVNDCQEKTIILLFATLKAQWMLTPGFRVQ